LILNDIQVALFYRYANTVFFKSHQELIADFKGPKGDE